MPCAFITGITGQDGSYLAELLLAKGYEVHGLIRTGSDPARSWLAPVASRLVFHLGDLTAEASLRAALNAAQPDELYHLAAQTSVDASFADEDAGVNVNYLGTTRLLDATLALARRPRFFHASSCQIFGQPNQEPQDESTPAAPVTPYGEAKLLATCAVQAARDRFGLFAVNGICFNHESPRRGPEFVTGKICRAAAAIRLGRQRELVLGDTTAQRDWGDAREFVEGFWRALQHDTSDDYVFATGKLHSVQDVAEIAFATVGLDWRAHVRSDPALFRASEPTRLVGNATKAREVLGWQVRKPFRELIAEMTTAALAEAAG